MPLSGVDGPYTLAIDNWIEQFIPSDGLTSHACQVSTSLLSSIQFDLK